MREGLCQRRQWEGVTGKKKVTGKENRNQSIEPERLKPQDEGLCYC